MLRFFASDGFAGKVGGSGTVFGSNAFQDITIADQPDDITFDASFNRGGDIIRFANNASAYSIALNGSSAMLDDGDSSYTLPVGTAGIVLVFADGVRTLRFDDADSKVKIGTQVVDGVFAQITAPDDGSSIPTGAVFSADARVFLSEGAEITTGGNQNVFGTSDGEDVNYMYGDLVLDPSFNKGGDTLHLPNPVSEYTVYRSGSLVILMSGDGTITVPVGTAGMMLDFDGDMRLLRFDNSDGTVKIGDSDVSATSAEDALPVGVSGGGDGGSLDQGEPATPFVLNLLPDTSNLLVDNAAEDSNVVINGFDDDDQILVTNASADDYNFGTGQDPSDLYITYVNSSAGASNEILIDDVLTGNSFVHDYESAIDAAGWNFITFA